LSEIGGNQKTEGKCIIASEGMDASVAVDDRLQANSRITII